VGGDDAHFGDVSVEGFAFFFVRLQMVSGYFRLKVFFDVNVVRFFAYDGFGRAGVNCWA